MTGAIFWLIQTLRSPGSTSAYGFAFLLAVAVKSTIFLLFAAVLAVAMRQASAAMRHLVWTLALAGALGVPILSVIAPAWKVPLSVPSPAQAAGERAVTVQSSSRVAQSPPVRPEDSFGQAPSAIQQPGVRLAWFTWMLVLWTGGFLLLLARAAVGEIRVRRLGMRSQRLEASQANIILEKLSRELGVLRRVRLSSSRNITIPFTRGLLHPAIVLPPEARHWSQEQLEFVLAHELGHVKRYDCVTQILAQTACALFWFNPLVWIAACEMSKERERACDDVVLNLGHEAAEYGEFLLQLIRSLRRLAPVWPASVSMAQSSRLEVRMKALLDCGLNHKPLARGRVLLFSLLALALLLPAAAIQATVKSAAPKGISPKAWKILSEVGDKYASLKSYTFSGTDETRIRVDKSIYRFTTAVEVTSGGTPELTGCHFTGARPIERITGDGPARPGLMIAMACGDVYDFAGLPENALSAELVEEGSVEANGRTTHCYVIQLRWRPVEGRPSITQGDMETLWIDKSTNLVLRARFEKFNDTNSAHPHVVERWSTTFSSYHLNGPTPEWLRTTKQHSEQQDRAVSARMTGKAAPAFTLNDLSGHSVSLGSLRGKVVLIDFWATWCGPCREEEPVLEKLEQELGTGQLAILRITNQSPELVRSYLQRVGAKFPTLADGEKVSTEYEVRGIPTLVVINKAGKIVTYNVGFLSENDLKADLRTQGL